TRRRHRTVRLNRSGERTARTAMALRADAAGKTFHDLSPGRTQGLPRGLQAVNLLQATTPHQWDEARRLVREYAASLNVDLSFQNFEHELEHFTSEYAAPKGAFILAEHDGSYVACIGLRPFADDVGEIKRLYVSPAA